MGRLDSLLHSKRRNWGQYWQILEAQLGATATSLNLASPGHALNSTTWTGRQFNASGLAPTWTGRKGGTGLGTAAALSTWATAFDLVQENNWYGDAPILTFNGTDESITTPDAAYWSRAETGKPVAMGAWINVTNTAAVRTIMSKWDLTNSAEAREWSFDINASDVVSLLVYDESQNVGASRVSDVDPGAGVYVFVVIVYDSTGGTDAMGANGSSETDNAKVYVNGTIVASTAADNGSYSEMEDLGTVVKVGAVEGTDGNPAQFFSGSMFGGPWSPWFAQFEPTAAQILNIYEGLRVGLAI